MIDRKNNHYIGVAPEADLVIVRLWRLTKGDRGENQTPPANPPLSPPSKSKLSADALRYILEVARIESKPVGINCSFELFRNLWMEVHRYANRTYLADQQQRAINSDATDYRYASRQTGEHAELREVELSDEVAEKCIALSRHLELPLAELI
jgi:hypothetical protein